MDFCVWKSCCPVGNDVGGWFAGHHRIGIGSNSTFLSSSAQRELLDHLRDLQIVGVPTLLCPPAVRRAVETAWFEQRTLRIVYRKPNGHDSPRLVRIRNIDCERTQMLLDCDDLATKAERQFRTDRVMILCSGHAAMA